MSFFSWDFDYWPVPRAPRGVWSASRLPDTLATRNDWCMTPEPTLGTSLAMEAGSELTKEGASLVRRMLGPAADEIGEHLRLKVGGYLARNRRRTIDRAAEYVEASGKEAHEIPLRTLLPALEGASLEDHPELSARWAALLANAALADDDDFVQPVFASILRNLTPAAARCLDALRTTKPRRGDRSRFSNAVTESGGIALLELGKRFGLKSPLGTRESLAELQRLQALLDVLVREGLATAAPALRSANTRITGDMKALGGLGGLPSPVIQDGLDIRITYLGIQFLLACSPPTPRTA